MLVSWNWLRDYLPLDGISPDEVADRLMMAGLNRESIEAVGRDTRLDIEITSNRPDCLGHLGIAREIAVLLGHALQAPAARLPRGDEPITQVTKVRVEAPELCPRYTARVIRGVKVGPSPAWLVERLATIGVASVNNVVDVTNYVLMECGQPLHAFDLAKLAGREIVVRAARAGEKITAINHEEYTLPVGACVIADAARPVALGGVMGGFDTEISSSTRDVLIEAADFAPLSIRTTARAVGLHSPSSYRFERGVDPAGVDWASRRCCELILQVAGGTLAEGVLDVGAPVVARRPIALRSAQIPRVLGIAVDPPTCRRILTALGCQEVESSGDVLRVTPPSWRRDLEREIDLIEEVARVHGYDKIPEDARVPMAPSHRRDEDRVMDHVRAVLTGAGMHEALTISFVEEAWSAAFSPWSEEAPLRAQTPLLRGADRLRRSLVPSLLGAKRINETLGNSQVELFETARGYLPRPGQLPAEPLFVSLVSSGDFARVKGIVEALVARLNPTARLAAAAWSHPLITPGRGCRLTLNEQLVGYLGEVGPAGRKIFELRGKATIAELQFDVLAAAAQLVPQFQPIPEFPGITEDLNLVVDEAVRWGALADTVRAAGGDLLERVDYRETFRDAKKDGPGKKRLIFSFTLRSPQRTLTGDEAKAARDAILAACAREHGAKLLG